MNQTIDLSQRDAGSGQALALIGILSAVPALGLFAAAQCLSLPWMAGEGAVLCAVLCALAASLVQTRARLETLQGLQAAAYARRGRQISIAAVALLVVALPAYQYQRLPTPGDQHVPITIALSAALAVLVFVIADALLRCWFGLQAQEWERKVRRGTAVQDDQSEGAGRVNREALLTELRRWWLGGTTALAAVLALCAGRAAPAWALPLLSVSLALTLILGLALVSEAARLRQTTYWELEDIAIEPALLRQWPVLGFGFAAAALGAVAALLAFRLTDLAAAAEYWVVWSVLVPWARWIIERIGNRSAANLCSGTQCAVPKSLRGIPPHLSQGHGGAHPAARSFDWSWLARDWPLLLGAVALLILARAMLGAQRQAVKAGFWRRTLRALRRDLRRLLALLTALKRPLALLLEAVEDRAGSRRGVADDTTGTRRFRRAAHGSRQRIIDLYVAFLRSAARHGYPRRPGQTAQEYAEAFPERFPAAAAAISELTDLFVAARYGAQPVEAEKVTRMRELRKQLQRLLRG